MKKENEYKGIYAQDNENIIYYEHGAHFSYKELYKRLEEIIKNNNTGCKSKDIVNNKIIFGNLKKASSQKVIRYKNNKKIKINISRNSNANHNLLCNNLNNHLKIGKSKSINKLLNFSKSYNEEQFGPFALNTKKNKYTKKAKELIIKKNFNQENNKTPMNNNVINKINKNNHTVLKYVMMSKKCTNKNEMNSDYYGISPNKIIDTDLNSYGEISLNPTCYFTNSSKKKKIDLNKNKNYSNKDIQNNSKKYSKIKISSIINKRFIQKSISDSPKSSSSFLNNNSSNYSQSKTQRTSENIINYSTYTCKKQKNDSFKKFNSTNKLFNIKKSYKSLSKNILKESNNNYIDNYYVGNNNVNRIYNNINKNIFLSNNQKNKKLTIFNNINKINYLNNCKNSFLLVEKEKNINSNKNPIVKQYKSNQKLNYNIHAKESSDILFINDNDNYNSYYYNDSNITPNIRKKIRKNLTKNHFSHNNILSTNTPDNNDIDKNNDNIDTMAFCINHESNSVKNKKSRNKSKNIVNLLCCHFSININSPINLLNNIQNNISTNTNNNKTSKIIGKTLGMAEENRKNEKKNSNCLKINNNKDINFKKESQKLDISKIKKKESKEIIKIIKSKIKKIPINITKDNNSKKKINLKASKNNSNKDINNYFKSKNEKSFNKIRFNSSKKIVEKKTSTNNINNSFNYNKKSNYNINNANNNNITYNSNNININKKVNVNNSINRKISFY